VGRARRLVRCVALSPPRVRVRHACGPLSPLRLGIPDATLAVISSLAATTPAVAEISTIDLGKLCASNVYHRKAIRYGDAWLEADFLGAPVETVREDIARAHIALVTANMTQNAGAAALVIHELKRLHPQVVVLVGGTDATFRPDFYLSHDADVVVRGEAETLLPRLLTSLADGGDFSSLPNLAWRTRQGGTQCSPMMDSSARGVWLPQPDKWVLPLLNEVTIGSRLHEGRPPEGVSSRSVYLETSRGCRPGDCGFCTTPYRTGGGSGYRRMPIDHLAQLLDAISDRNVTTVQVSDDNLLARCDEKGGEDELFGSLSLMRQRGLAWEFANGLQLSRLISAGRPREDLLRALFSPQVGEDGRLVGGYRLFLPLETLPVNTSERYRRWSKMRGLDEAAVLGILEGLDRAGIRMVSLGVMIGFPDDTPKHIDAVVDGMGTISAAIRRMNRARRANGVPEMDVHWDVTIYMLLPGTPDYAAYKHRLLFQDGYDSHPELVNFHTAAYHPLYMSAWDLTKIRHEIARDFGSVEVPQEDGSTYHQFAAV